MTSQTRTPHQLAVRSTVAMKILMAVTGLILIAFLLAHMLGNLKLFIPVPTTGPNAGVSEFTEYSHLLRRLFYPVFPPRVFLWIMRLALIAAVVAHMWSAFRLRARKTANVGTKRYVTTKRMVNSYAARTMIWGGIIIVAFVVLHLLQFTIIPSSFGFDPHSDPDGPRKMVLHAFQNPLYFVVYLVAMAAVCIHVWHGFWSAFATLGGNVSATSQRVLKACATVFAVALFVGFMISPLAVLTRLVS